MSIATEQFKIECTISRDEAALARLSRECAYIKERLAEVRTISKEMHLNIKNNTIPIKYTREQYLIGRTSVRNNERRLVKGLVTAGRKCDALRISINILKNELVELNGRSDEQTRNCA